MPPFPQVIRWQSSRRPLQTWLKLVFLDANADAFFYSPSLKVQLSRNLHVYNAKNNLKRILNCKIRSSGKRETWLQGPLLLCRICMYSISLTLRNYYF